MPWPRPGSFLPKEVAGVDRVLAESGRFEPQTLDLQPVPGAASSTARTAHWAGLRVGLPLPMGSYLGPNTATWCPVSSFSGMSPSSHLKLGTATRSSAPFPPHLPDAQFQKATWPSACMPSPSRPHAPSVSEACLSIPTVPRPGCHLLLRLVSLMRSGPCREGGSLLGCRLTCPPFSDTVPHARFPLLDAAAFTPFPDGASATPSEGPPSSAFRPSPIWWQRSFPSHPPQKPVSPPSLATPAASHRSSNRSWCKVFIYFRDGGVCKPVTAETASAWSPPLSSARWVRHSKSVE